MLIKYMCDWKSQTLRMHYPFQSTRRPISHQNLSSLHIYMIPFVQDFVPEWNSRTGTTTRVNSRQGDSRLHDILCWYHVNKCRAMRGNRSELAPGWLMYTPPYSLWNQCPRMAKETWSRRSWRGRGDCILKIVIAEGVQFSFVIIFWAGVKFWYTNFFWTPLTPRLVPKTKKFSLKLLCDFI